MKWIGRIVVVAVILAVNYILLNKLLNTPKSTERYTHILVLEGDTVVRHIKVPKGRFIFVVNNGGIGYTDTSKINPVWWTPIHQLQNIGSGHQNAIYEALSE